MTSPVSRFPWHRRAALPALLLLGGLIASATVQGAEPPAGRIPVDASPGWVRSLIDELTGKPGDQPPTAGYRLVFADDGVSLVPSATGREKTPALGTELDLLDILLTDKAARAGLLSAAEAAIADEYTEVQVTKENTLNLVRGTLYIKSLASRAAGPKIAIETTNGVVQPDGTEFQVQVADGQTRVWVAHGAVSLTNQFAGTRVASPTQAQPGQPGYGFAALSATGTAAPETSPEQSTLLSFSHVVQWALYYPAILNLEELPDKDHLAQDEALRPSLDAYRRGDPVAARRLYPPDRQPRTRGEVLYRAALLTAAGRIEEVERSLEELCRPQESERVAGRETDAAINLAASPAPPASGPAARPVNAGERDATGPSDAADSETPTERARRLAQAFTLMIAAVRHDPRPAPLPGGPATSPTLATEWLAESYFRQGSAENPDNIGHALKAARAATNAQPGLVAALGRVADLEFSRGHTRQAQRVLDEALALAPDSPPLLTLKGYLQAARSDVKGAIDSFIRAVEKDGRLGDAWLGLGLCLIRQGHTEAGLRFIQMAVSREPQRATFKSYLAKGYEVAGRPKAALEELKTAERTDPGDPTPRLYSALIKRGQNRINDAIEDLEESKRLNDDRFLFRSRALLDQDRAVRSANLAGLYRDAGMTDVSVREATRAVTSDYGNSSAHLFLANSYDAYRDPRQITLRYETPWLNELLIAQLLQPTGGGSLSQTVSQQEYSRLFQQDGFGLFSRTEYTSNGDWLESASQYGTLGNTDYSVDAFYQDFNGQRVNDDFRGLTLWGKVKQQLTPDDSVLLQAVFYDSDAGDNRQLYSPTNALPNFRVEETQRPTLLAGYHHRWSPEHQTLFLAGWLNDTIQATDQEAPQHLFMYDDQGQPLPDDPYFPFRNDLDYESELNLFSAELQHIWQVDRFTTIGGVRYQFGQFETDSLLNDPKDIPPYPPIIFSDTLADQHVDSDFNRFSAYLYENWEVWHWLTLVAGVAYDQISYPVNHRSAPISTVEDDRSQVSPKAGFILSPIRDTTVRGSYTRSLGGLSFDQSFRLEPTQVAGFVQSYRSLIPESEVGSLAGPDFETLGLLIDHRFPTRTYVALGAERLASSATQYGGSFDSIFAEPITPSSIRSELDYEEQSLNATVNQLLGSCWSIGARYRFSHTELDQKFENPLLLSGTTQAELHSLDSFVLLNLPCGFFAEAQALWRSQTSEGYDDRPGDSFAQFNAFVGYRFLRRRAEVRLGVLNLSDEDYQLNPLSFYAELPRERMLYASLKLDF